MVTAEQKRARDRASVVLLVALFATVFVLINSQQYLLGAIIYIVIGLMSLSLYRQWAKIGKPGNLVGIDDDFVKDFIVGVLLGVGTIFLSTISPFIGTLGIPNVQSIAGTIGRFTIIVIAAPIFEEILFRDFILDALQSKIANFPFIVANLITAALFSFYHLTAYGESLSAVSGSFITAALMGFIFGIVRYYQKSVAGAIAYHMVLNLYIGFISLAVIIG